MSCLVDLVGFVSKALMGTIDVAAVLAVMLSGTLNFIITASLLLIIALILYWALPYIGWVTKYS